MKKLLRQPIVQAAAIFLVLIFILYNPVITGGKTFGTPDSLNPKSAGIALERAWEESGEFPLWQPWIFSGMPTAEAFTFISALYFPSYLLKILFLSGVLAQLAHLLFAALGMYVLVWKFSKDFWASLAAGIGFIGMPFLTTMLVFGHGSQMMTAAYIPWIFYFVTVLFDSPSLKSAGWLALLLGFQLQRGHVQIAYYTWLLIGFYMLWKGIDHLKNGTLKNWLLSTGWFIGVAIIGIGLAIAIYYPSLGYTEYSVRGAAESGGAQYGYATSWSFHPMEMLTFLIPAAYGFGGQTYWGHMPFTDYPNYMGLLFLLMAIYGYIKNRNSFTHFLVASWFMALFISFGSHFPLIYNLFYDYFPFFNKFRVPSMILVLVQFITVLLGGMGLKSLFANLSEVGKNLKYAVIALAVLLAILVVGDGLIKSVLSGSFTPPRSQDPRTIQYINSLRADMWIRDAWIGLLLVGTSVAALWVVQKNYLSVKLFPAVLVLLMIVDIGRVDWAILYPGKNSGRQSQLIANRTIKQYFSEDEIIRFLKSDSNGPFRIYPVGPWFAESRFRAFDIESVGGYHPAKLNNYNTFLTETKNASTLALIKMLNARYLVSPQQLAFQGISQVKTGKLISSRGLANAFVYRVEGDIPRAWFVAKVENMSATKNIYPRLQNPDFDPYRVSFVAQHDEIAGEYSPGVVLSSEYDLHRITLTAQTEGEAFLVLSEVYYPLRWRARIDDEETEIYEMNGFMRGIQVPAGTHEITLWYDRGYFKKGILVSLFSLVLGLSAIVAGFILQRKGS